MKSYLSLLIFISTFVLACTKDKEVQPQSAGEISFKIDKDKFIFPNLTITEISLDYDQGMGKLAYGKETFGNQTITVMLDLKPVNNEYKLHKFQINILTKKAEGLYHRELHYANLTPELNETKFLYNFRFSNSTLDGTLSGHLVPADKLSPNVQISEGRMKVRID